MSYPVTLKRRLAFSALILLAAACTHVREGETKPITIARVGDLHNRLLAEFYRANPSRDLPAVTFQDHEELMQELGVSLVALGGRRSEVQSAIRRGNARLDQLGLFKVGTLEPDVDLSGVLISDLVSRRMISTTLASELYKIQDLSFEDVASGSPAALAYINSDFADRAWSVSDKTYAAVFSSVARSSAVFWEDPANTAQLRPGSSTIIADAAGALWGSLLGPVGSILYGAGFSLYENEFLRVGTSNRAGLGCIPRSGRFCNEEGYGCLVMFPEARWSLMRRLHPHSPLELDGEAEVRLGEQPTLSYKLRSAPVTGAKVIPVDSDFSLPSTAAASLGFGSVTILKGRYEIDARVGEFGGMVFNVAVTPTRRPSVDQERR